MQKTKKTKKKKSVGSLRLLKVHNPNTVSIEMSVCRKRDVAVFASWLVHSLKENSIRTDYFEIKPKEVRTEKAVQSLLWTRNELVP